MPDRLPCIRMVGGRVAAIEIAVGILIRLLKQKGQAAEIISGLVPRWKNFAEWLRRNLCIPDQEYVDSLILL